MSRSIHTTRHQLEMLEHADYADLSSQQRIIARLRGELETKRSVKRHVLDTRHASNVTARSVDADTIPILIEDASEVVHFPASEHDLRAVMRRLPLGILDGLQQIVMCLGKKYQNLNEEPDEDDMNPDVFDRDPFTGRLGWESFPGVFTGRFLGTYFPNMSTIHLYAYAYRSDLQDRTSRELFLRTQMLITFLHEIAHHHERHKRDRRARWREVGHDASERRSNKQAQIWAKSILIPYLEDRYPEEISDLYGWMVRHGGVAVPLARLADDALHPTFPISEAIEGLARAVDEGEPPNSARRTFAFELHLSDLFEEALVALAPVVVEEPDNVKALALQADIYEHLERCADAERAAQVVLGLDNQNRSAWKTLEYVYQAQGNWQKLEDAATQVIGLSGSDPRRSVYDLSCRAKARIELGDSEGASADIETLEGLRSRRWHGISLLRALLALRSGDYAIAFQMATSALQRRMAPWRAELAAVRFEAAHRLGLPDKARKISARLKVELRQRGFGVWVDQLERLERGESRVSST